MTDSSRRSSRSGEPSGRAIRSVPRSAGAGTSRDTDTMAPGRRPSSCVSITSGERGSREIGDSETWRRDWPGLGEGARDRPLGAGAHVDDQTDVLGYRTLPPRPTPGLRAEPLAAGPQDGQRVADDVRHQPGDVPAVR